MRSGVILAGGRSTRFGDGDKAVADLAGVPMVRRVADRVGRVVDELVVNCRADQTAALREALDGVEKPVSVAEDETPDMGPMVGLMTGLRAAEGGYAAVVSCDMPFVDPAFLDHLFDRAAGRDAAVPRVDGHYQPTQAVYRTRAVVAACEEALARGDRSALSPVLDVDLVVVEGEELRTRADSTTFENVNTRAEFAAAAERLRDGSP